MVLVCCPRKARGAFRGRDTRLQDAAWESRHSSHRALRARAGRLNALTFPWQDGGQLVDLRHCRGNAPPHGACVQSCALDAVARVYDVTVVVDALAGMDMTAGASQAALEAMARAGVRQASCDDVLSAFLTVEVAAQSRLGEAEVPAPSGSEA